jgi:proteasome alpha subunit
MQGQNQQQAYDRGITIFSPDGRLYQVEYAREAVKRGTASLGVRAEDGVVLAVDKRIRSPMLEGDSVEKLHKVDNHIGVASAGHVADARQLIDLARRNAQVNRLRYDEPIDVESLTKGVTDHIQQYTQVGGARPFGVSLIIGGVEEGQPRLYETDPSGTPYEWRALAIGSGRSEIQDYLEAEYADDLSIDEAVGLALAGLAEASEDGLEPASVGVATVDAESGRYIRLTDDEIAEFITDLDLEADEEDDGQAEGAEDEEDTDEE